MFRLLLTRGALYLTETLTFCEKREKLAKIKESATPMAEVYNEKKLVKY